MTSFESITFGARAHLRDLREATRARSKPAKRAPLISHSSGQVCWAKSLARLAQLAAPISEESFRGSKMRDAKCWKQEANFIADRTCASALMKLAVFAADCGEHGQLRARGEPAPLACARKNARLHNSPNQQVVAAIPLSQHRRPLCVWREMHEAPQLAS